MHSINIGGLSDGDLERINDMTLEKLKKMLADKKTPNKGNFERSLDRDNGIEDK